MKDEPSEGNDQDDVRWSFARLCIQRLISLKAALDAVGTDQEAMIGVSQQKEVVRTLCT